MCVCVGRGLISAVEFELDKKMVQRTTFNWTGCLNARNRIVDFLFVLWVAHCYTVHSIFHLDTKGPLCYELKSIEQNILAEKGKCCSILIPINAYEFDYKSAWA